jgi:prepilin-type N-terminal cleavage/methylation domain-containing protein
MAGELLLDRRTFYAGMGIKDSTMTWRQTRHGFTLVEVVLALAIITVVFAGVILAYSQATYRAQWTGYSLAAESLAMKQIEQARSARWDPANPNGQVLEIYSLNLQNSNYVSATQVLTGYTWTNLDLPSSGTNFLRATNFVTVKPVPSNLNGTNLMIKIDTVWTFTWRNTRLFTNTVCTYLAPDNKDSTDLFGN